MEKHNFSKLLKEGWGGILLSVLIGGLAYGIKIVTKSPLVDPLLVAIIIGITVRTTMGKKGRLKAGFALAPVLFIPLGIIFYAAKNLNFAKFAKIEINMLVLLVIIILVYFAVIFILGKLLRQKKEITYLTAIGSGICGASAIAITSPVVEAEADDISISLLSVALAGSVGLFIVLPFLATLFGITNKIYGLLSGSVLQFTGFVKAAVVSVPFLTKEMPAGELVNFALSVKAVRYLGLLIAFPLFGSLVKKKFYIPWFLWAFLGAGLFGTWICVSDEIFYTQKLIPFIEPIYDVSWSIALGAVGLNADVKQLLSNNGTKAMIIAFSGFVAAIVTFFVGLYVIQLL